nr:sulfite exporter TauE/SafE family protein [Kofleriaceae bacterium]
MDPLVLYVVGVVFVATLVRSTVGFGEALVAVPLLALRVPVVTAVPLAALLSVAIAAGVVVQDHREIERRSAAWLVAATLPGIPLGLWLLDAADDHVVKAVLAAVIGAFSIYSLVARRPPQLAHDSRAALVGAGFAAGVLGGAYGMNGPPLVLYGALRRWPAPVLRATLQAYFLPASLLAVVGYGVTGLLVPEVWRDAASCVPGAAVAFVLGRVLNRRLAGRDFARFVFAGLLVIAVLLVVES